MEMKHQKFKECNIDLHKWGIRCSVGYPAVLEILMEKKCFLLPPCNRTGYVLLT